MAEEESVQTEGAVDESAAMESKARGMGWIPQEEFKGDPAKWYPAEEFVRRGEEFIPFLRTANKDLKSQVDNLSTQLRDTQRLLHAATSAINELKDERTEETVANAEEQRENLKREIIVAHKDGDIEKELTLRDKLEETTEELRGIRRPEQRTNGGGETRTEERKDYTKTPEFQQFLQDTPEFASDPVFASACVTMTQQLAKEGKLEGLTPAERYALSAAETRKRFGMGDAKRTQRVEGGRPSGGGGGATSRQSYESLPQDAKEACDKLESRMVGKKSADGKIKFPDQAAWRRNYASTYFSK